MLMKYTLRNIFTKKGRLFILMLCISFACFTANVALELSASARNMVSNFTSGDFGDSDFRLVSFGKMDTIDEHTFDDSPVPVRYITPFSSTKTEIRRSEEYYNYALTDNVKIFAFPDPATAQEMKMFKNVTIPEKGEITIGERYAEKYGYKVGDRIGLYGFEDEQDTMLTVSSIFQENTFLGGSDRALYAVINYEQYTEIYGEKPARAAYLQVIKDNDIEVFEEYLKTNHKGLTYINYASNESADKLINNLIAILYLVFALVFVLVIFVTISFTEKIIVERMSVIGTLRSIGMSVYKTTAILLFENVLYGLAGGIFGLIPYLVLRTLATMMIDEAASALGSPNIPRLLLVIVGAMVIETMIPLKEVLKAVKTSIRDIIFESRDAEYKINYPATVIGLILIVAGILTGLLAQAIVPVIASLLLIIVGGGMMVCMIVRNLTWKLSGVFADNNMPVAELAAKECGSKKPNASNAVLAITTICAATAVVVAGLTFVRGMGNVQYDADIVITQCNQKVKKLEFINELEGVEETEFLYNTSETVKIGSKNYLTDVYMVPEGDSFIPLKDVDKNLSADEIILDMTSAHRADAKVGDVIKVTFHSDGVIPIEKELKVKDIVNFNNFDPLGKMILPRELYKEMYSKKVSIITVRSNSLYDTLDALEQSLTGGENIQTIDQIKKENKKNKLGIIVAILFAIFASMALTLIGISGNQVIGFASRKKEFAMLHSCACDQASIIRMIVIENALLFGFSVILAGALSVPVIAIVNRIFRIAELGIYASPNYALIIVCLIVLFGVTMLTVLSPIKSLKKMNTAMELKYE